MTQKVRELTHCKLERKMVKTAQVVRYVYPSGNDGGKFGSGYCRRHVAVIHYLLHHPHPAREGRLIKAMPDK
eukprot:9265146-Heterocapsa_arctica.AAC.1